MEMDVYISSLDKTFKGTLSFVSKEGQAGFPIEITIDNSKGEIRVGMKAEAVLE